MRIVIYWYSYELIIFAPADILAADWGSTSAGTRITEKSKINLFGFSCDLWSLLLIWINFNLSMDK